MSISFTFKNLTTESEVEGETTTITIKSGLSLPVTYQTDQEVVTSFTYDNNTKELTVVKGIMTFSVERY